MYGWGVTNAFTPPTIAVEKPDVVESAAPADVSSAESTSAERPEPVRRTTLHRGQALETFSVFDIEPDFDLGEDTRRSTRRSTSAATPPAGPAAWKAAQSPLADKVFVAPGNAGTALEPNLENVAIGVDDIVARNITVDQPTALRSIELLGDVRVRLAELTR